MNIREVAVLAETSVATVSRVLNNDSYVSDETRRRVMEVIEATGYKPSTNGRAQKGKTSGKILALLPSISNPYYSRVLQGLEHRASAFGYDTLACITHRNAANEMRYLELLKQNQVDGVVGCTSALSDEKLTKLAAKHPYVQCGARTGQANICYTCIDNISAAEDAIVYFVKTGHKRIAFINGMFGRPYEVEREIGYHRVLEHYGIPFRPEYLIGCDYNYSSGYDSCEMLMSLSEAPTAIFTSCDQTAAGVEKYLLKHNLVPGQDVDIIGFDGTYLSGMCTPAISSIDQPGYDMGKTSFDLLYERITDPKSTIKRVIMSHTLSLRETTRMIGDPAKE